MRETCNASPCPRGWSDVHLTARTGGVAGLPSVREPFLLFDDARPGGVAYLFQEPHEVIRADRADDIPAAMARLREASTAGYHLAGYLTYEAANAFDPPGKAAGVSPATTKPLLWMGMFDQPLFVDPQLVLPDPSPAVLEARPRQSKQAYVEAVQSIIDYIRAGDLYQANFTFQADVRFADDPVAHYARLRLAQRAGWGALVQTGEELHLSFSPEMYFTTSADSKIWAKPMKGTAQRVGDIDKDQGAARALGASAKDRAENLMIVDLIRNDLSIVSDPGSVKALSLFEIEQYPTLFQMTSTLQAQLRAGKDVVDLINATFPCGSITGAPKLRARQIIAELEGRPRGLYTGMIGFMAPDGRSAFNVAIRTVSARAGDHGGTIGLGSGITTDSIPEAEWRECLSKARFLNE